MPIFGGFVRTFREHHADQVDISAPATSWRRTGTCASSARPCTSRLLLVVQDAFALACISVYSSAATPNSQLPVGALPERRGRFCCCSARAVPVAEHHARHHSGPHLTHYCITNGWMNTLLDGSGFFRKLEWLLLQARRPPAHDTARD